MNRFIVAEPAKCIGCRTCEIACALAHGASAAPADAGAGYLATGVAGLTGKAFEPRLKVIKTLNVSTPVTCRHCEDAPCANACPNGAISTRDHTIQVDQSRCIGCKTCMIACPFGAMDVVSYPQIREFAGVAIADGVKAAAHKCDLCLGKSGGPACISVCPTDALHVMTEASAAETRALRQLRAALDTPRVEAVA
ncbi:4Fe-4S dicluster domain-containing protein [Siculibacillus lacustris]|uniref:4Fe-4S dicluster domain-containing protein n=1 Tax=Siculibacillus lacustris TaxID=1549641 RepID=A0A4Q9VVP4_9HYPH|nr:4Fe-4S dicluster domain-containing protein [Siculibacillus lacustris]TBW40332.1 4Fe-4S dicluster domain-containing protein [Siculibacillus lacustris]